MGTAFRQPQVGVVVAAVLNEGQVLATVHQAAGDLKTLHKALVLWCFVVESKVWFFHGSTKTVQSLLI